jgi:hypothetical protein
MKVKRIGLGILLASSCTLAAATEEEMESTMQQKTLAQVVAERPYPEYRKWWPIREEFSRFMSEAIVSEWSSLFGNEGDLDYVKALTSEYLKTVYDREAATSLVEDFVRKEFSNPLQSGEFDALSYAFFRSAYEEMERRVDSFDLPLETERRLLTKRVGMNFFAQVQDHLDLDLPQDLDNEGSFEKLKRSIDAVNVFLHEQGYVRDRSAFRFDVEVERQGRKVVQSEAAFLESLKRASTGYALYEMSYPAILPSAVYLFHTIGEAQHHSSRTLEELFDQVGFVARETADFDPIGYPSNMVVEVWEISKKP